MKYEIDIDGNTLKTDDKEVALKFIETMGDKRIEYIPSPYPVYPIHPDPLPTWPNRPGDITCGEVFASHQVTGGTVVT